MDAAIDAKRCGRLLSVNVGKPKDISWQRKTVHTGIFKSPVAGPRLVRRLNVEGDGQGDLGGHGGEQRAILVYQDQSYRHWAEFLDRDHLTYGSFSENFTVDGLPDDEVCIGDRYRIGEAEFEVTQPRVTCFRVGIRLNETQMPALLVSHRRPGFYLRVITEGNVQAGDLIFRTRRGRHQLSVADTDALLYLPNRSDEALRKAVDIPALSPGWRQSFNDLLTKGLSATPVAGPSHAEPAWTGFRPMTVKRISTETPTISSIYLRSGQDQTIGDVVAGQYLTVKVVHQGVTAVRSYSISGTPDGRTLRISVKREEHGQISRYLHDSLLTGATLDVAAPRGQFRLHEGDEPVLLVSAGVGATPLVMMLHQLVSDQSTRRIWWIHTARDQVEHVFADEVRGYLDQLPNARSVTFYTRTDSQSDPGAPDKPESGTGQRVVVHDRPTATKLLELALPPEAKAYLCGPPAFIISVTASLAALGFRPDQILAELFGTLPPINPGVLNAPVSPPHQPPGEPGTGPAVTFARSGITTRWRSSEDSLLELAEACDIPTRWSCRSGVCQTCLTSVISGEVNYQPVPLESPPASQALLCCSRPANDLVLDN